MNTNALTRLTLGLLFAASLAPCQAADDNAAAQGTSLPPGTLAIVNGVPISQSQLDDVLRVSRQPDTPQMRQFFTQELIVREVLRQSAEKHGYDQRPEVMQAVSMAKATAEAELYLRDNLRLEPITDAQVRARYEEVIGMMGKEEYKVRIISVADDQTARTVLEKLRAGVSFDELVRMYSVAASKETGGEMPWMTFRLPVAEGKTQGVPVPVAEAISRLEVGAVTQEPVVVDNLRVIVRLDAKRATQVPAFDEVKEDIRRQLHAVALNKARADVVGSLMQSAIIRK
jgi:parvulin-like peptidyl-prolyl isomerase